MLRIRILYMPPVYAIVSFFSYRFFRDYTYYSLAETSALALSFPESFSLILLPGTVYEVCSKRSSSKMQVLDDTKGHHIKRLLVHFPYPFQRRSLADVDIECS